VSGYCSPAPLPPGPSGVVRGSKGIVSRGPAIQTRQRADPPGITGVVPENGFRKRALEICWGTLHPQRSEEDQGQQMSSARKNPDFRGIRGIYFRAPFSLKNFSAPGCMYLIASGVTMPTDLAGVSAVAPFQTATSSALLSKIALTIW
jgi:hypothetical protein